MVIGLDCAPPTLVFERYRARMPALRALMKRGSWGPLRSCVPPITVPAWACMLSGRDPGELGLYGFRVRQPGAYGMRVADARDMRAPRAWDWLGEAGKHVCVLGVPLTYPPSPVHGELVSCLLTPTQDSVYTYPPSLQAELQARFGPYRMDVEGFRSEQREHILEQIYAMTEQHFAMAGHMWRTREPDLLMLVEMGPDRLHHAFWQFFDPEHPAYRSDGPYQDVAERYYTYLDQRIAALTALADEDTALFVVSDHGARALRGGVCLNQWLIDHGYLRLLGSVTEPQPLASAGVDWDRTRAWAEGGYYARLFINLAGREPRGTVAVRDHQRLCAELAEGLRGLQATDGRTLSVRAVQPSEMYRQVRGVPPDLLVFFDDLAYRCIGSVGFDSWVSERNDLGPDGCNHAWDGIWVLAGAGAPARGCIRGLEIYDVAPTLSGLLGVRPPRGLLGKDRSQ